MTAKKTMYIMRGLPGSGKSHRARQIQHENPGTVVFASDDYFTSGFDPKKLDEAHQFNQGRARRAGAAAVPNIVIDNTCVQAWEAKPYVQIAVDYGYDVVFVEPDTPWAKDPAECARRCTHNVPLHTIQKMKRKWQDGLTVALCLGANKEGDRDRTQRKARGDNDARAGADPRGYPRAGGRMERQRSDQGQR